MRVGTGGTTLYSVKLYIVPAASFSSRIGPSASMRGTEGNMRKRVAIEP